MTKKKDNKRAEYQPLAKIKLDTLRRMIKSIERDYGGSPEIIDNMDITFEYIIASLFPKIMDNINEEFTHQYISGFNDRLDIKKTAAINKIDNITDFKYIIDDIEKTINSISISIRKDETSENDKKVLKQIHEILQILQVNINKIIKE